MWLFCLLEIKLSNMKSVIFIILSIASLLATNNSDEYKYKEQEIKAFNRINELRANPHLIKTELGINDHRLKKQAPLIWDETLAKAARQKAQDMATNNYFSHTDLQGRGMNIVIYEAGYHLPSYYINNKAANYCESISGGISDGAKIIDFLIIDKGVEPPGHRNHLMGLESYAEAKMCGIGIAYNPNSTYKYYASIIVVPKFQN